MKPRMDDVGSAIGLLIVLVVFPFAVISYFPKQYIDQLTSTGLDVIGILYQTMFIGAVVSFMTLAKAFVEKTSLVYLLLGLSSEGISLAYVLVVVGAGDVGSLGYSTFRIKNGRLTTVVALDLRVFVILTLVFVGVGMIKTVLLFRESRDEKTAPAIKAESTLKPSV